MTDQLNSQLSAFVDEALSEGESELLVRRLCRDDELRETLARYNLIGNVLRGDTAVPASGSFARGVMMAVEGQALPAQPEAIPTNPGRRRPLAAAAVAAMALAVVALVTLQDPHVDTAPLTAVATLDTPAVVPEALSSERLTPASFNVPFEQSADRYPEVRERLNRQLVQHLTMTGARQGLVNYRNVGYVTQVEARQ